MTGPRSWPSILAYAAVAFVFLAGVWLHDQARRLWLFVVSSGARSESDSSRGGVLSWSGESHAVVCGVAVGMVVGGSGVLGWVGWLVAGWLYVCGGESWVSVGLVRDLRGEVSYVVGGGVVGWVLVSVL